MSPIRSVTNSMPYLKDFSGNQKRRMVGLSHGDHETRSAILGVWVDLDSKKPKTLTMHF